MDSLANDLSILIAEDDDDDFFLVKKAFEDAGLAGSLLRVKDGRELMDFLLRKDPRQSPAYGKLLLLLLDLNMPRMSGREALKAIKAHPELRTIPVIVLSSSGKESDTALTYALGGDSFVKKPTNFEELVEFMRSLKKYQVEIVELPQGDEAQSVL